jgi:hypothetical protein
MIDRIWVWRQSEVENFRRVLAGEPTKPVTATKANAELVTITQLAKKIGVARRTVTRRVAEARAKTSAPAAKPSP